MSVITLYEFIDKIKNSKSKLLIIIGILLPCFSSFLPNKLLDSEMLSMLAQKTVQIILPVILISIFIYINTKLPSASKGSIGIAIVIKAETKAHREEIEAKFIHLFCDVIEASGSDIFDVVPVDANLTKKYKLNKSKDIEKLLKKMHCSYLISIHCTSGKKAGEEIYCLDMFNGILHATFEKEIEAKFSLDICDLMRDLFSVNINKKDDIEEFRSTSKELSLVSKYIIGTALYLSLDFESSLKILYSLQQQLVGIQMNKHSVEKLRSRLPERIYEINYTILYTEYNKFFINRGTTPDQLLTMHNALKNMNRAIPNTYPYYIEFASFSFLNNRDISTARDSINKAKRISRNKIWLYSDAFINLYEGNILSSYRIYMQALKVTYNFDKTLQYICIILEKEPQKGQLNLAITLMELKKQNFKRSHAALNLFSLWLDKSGGLQTEARILVKQLQEKICESSVVKIS